MPTGYIYEIKSTNTSITGTYIGSCWDMGGRLRRHTSNCYNENSNEYNLPLYKYIRENGDFHTFTMRVIDSGECEDEIELRCAEQFYIDMADGIENLMNRHDSLQDKKQRKKKQNVDNKNRREKNINTKKYPCEVCVKYFQSNRDLQRHYTSQKHKNKNLNLISPDMIINKQAKCLLL